MASAVVQQPSGHSTSFEPLTSRNVSQAKPEHTPQNVRTTLNYIKVPEDGSAPHPTYINRPETYDRPSLPTDVTINDVRGSESNYTLDSHGFQYYTKASEEKDFVDEEQIKSDYYAETERLLKEATGASRVFIFDHTIRRAPKAGEQASAAGARPAAREPVLRVHIDQSYAASRSRVPFHLPEDSDRLLQTRHQIINVWRPIKQIFKDPLTVADAHTVSESDLVPVALIYPNRNGETLGVKPNPNHRWYYLSEQNTDEVLLIKCYDSKLDGRARRVPHTAFSDPKHVDNYGRESIEIRALVFHEDQPAE